MSRRISVLLILIIFSGTPVFARYQSSTIRGSVVDASSGESLPGATIQIEQQFKGTITNEVGDFSLQVSGFPVSVVVRFIGYASKRATFDSAPADPVRFALEPSRVSMPEIVVSGENPARNIMKRVIEEKHKWRASFETYRVNAYNRFRMENDTGIVSIWESSTVAFWDKKRGIREISLSQKQTANSDVEDLLPAALFMKNLYDDDIEVAGHRLMGVTHKDALSHYDFTLTGTRAIDGQLVYDIAVKPSSKLGSGFVGSVAVLDSVYAILSADLEPGEAFLFPLPIKNLTVKYRQQFSRFGSNVWLPVDLRSSITLDISFQGLLSFPTFRIEQFSRLSDFELNVSLPDSLYESSEIVAADSTFLSTVHIAALEESAIPLTEKEIAAYETIDSTMTIEKAFAPRGLLARFVDLNDDSSDRESRRSRRRGGKNGGRASGFKKLDLRFEPAIWYNKVEGFHLGGSLALPLDGSVRLRGRAGYETERKGWTYGGDLHAGRRTWIEAGFRDYIPRRYESDIKGRLTNSLSVLFSQPDYFDYAHEREGYVSIGVPLPGWRRVRARLTVSASRYDSEVRRIPDGLLGKPDRVIPNAEIDEGTLQSVSFGLRYTADSVPFGIGGEYAVRLDTEHSLGGSIVETGSFGRVNGSVVWRIPTFYNRRLLPNTLDFRIMAGTFTGRLPRQRFGIIDGSGTITTFGGLKTRKDRPYEGESYAALMFEHSFRTILFERLGLDRLVQYGWNLIVTGAVARNWISRSRRAELFPKVDIPNHLHSEAGLSLSGLFGLVRIDYSRRLDANAYTVGIAFARIF